MALLLGLGVYTVNAKMKALEAENALTDQDWIFTGTDPTQSNQYSPAPTNAKDDCQGDSEVCVVSAPLGSNNQPNLNAVDGLMEALENDSPHSNITRGIYEPQ